MRAYTAVLKARALMLFQYRAAALAGLATQVFWGTVKVMILMAFYAQAHESSPISLIEATAFIWIGQGILHILPWNIDKEVEEQIKNGNVAYELIRPLNLYWLWFSRSVAMRLVPTLLRGIPLVVMAKLFFGLINPISWLAGVVFGLSLIFSLLLASAITTIVIITLFWTISGEGILRLLPPVAIVLSGLLVPLPLFPDWIHPFLDIQPFRCIIDIPCRLYTGMIPVHNASHYLALQLFWGLSFIFAGQLLLKKAVKQFVVQGG